MRKYFVEALGTFFLVFTIGMTVIEPGAGILTPLAIGASLAVMVFAGGHISGGHFNPAVSFGAWIRGKLTLAEMPGYMIGQVLGALLACGVVFYLKEDAMEMVTALHPPIGASLVAEFLFTFALVWVVLNVSAARKTEGNSFYGLAIGTTVMTGAFAVGGISGGAFNPAVAIGISTMGIVSWSALWIYLLANFAGGAVAAVAFLFTHPGE